MSDHRCDLPFTGSLHQCPTCGTWFHVVVFRDEAQGLSWKGWEPMEGRRASLAERHNSDPARHTQDLEAP